MTEIIAPRKAPLASILLADDEEIFLRTTAAMLRHNGYRCDTATSAIEAAEVLKTRAFDLLITDINMPGNSELEFLASTQNDGMWLPVIVVTGFPTVQSVVKSLRLAVVDYLVKPIDETEFLQHVARAVEKSEVLRDLKRAQDDMSESVERLQAMERNARLSASAQPPQAHALTLEQFLAMTLNNIVTSASSLKQTMDVLRTGKMDAEVGNDLCKMIRCPRLTQYERAIREAIGVLEKTKDSFKSKELAALRKALVESLNVGAER
jgi:CheY-like chemotaxis protein